MVIKIAITPSLKACNRSLPTRRHEVAGRPGVSSAQVRYSVAGSRCCVRTRRGPERRLNRANRRPRPPRRRRAATHRRVLARRQLPDRRSDLPARQRAAATAPGRGRREAEVARPLGNEPRAQHDLRAPGSRDRSRRPRLHLRDRSRARRPGDPRQHVARRELHRDVSRDRARRGRDAAAVPTVLVSRRRAEPRRAGDARARSTRAASSATRSATRSAPRSTTPISSLRASSATVRPRPVRSRRAGTRTSSSIRSATARCCRSCT